MTDKLPPLKPSDHPEPRIMQWSKLEMEFIQDYARQAVREAVPEGFVLVPVEPTEAMRKAAVIFANGNDVYKNVSAEVLEIEEQIYAEVYKAMIAAAKESK